MSGDEKKQSKIEKQLSKLSSKAFQDKIKSVVFSRKPDSDSQTDSDIESIIQLSKQDVQVQDDSSQGGVPGGILSLPPEQAAQDPSLLRHPAAEGDPALSAAGGHGGPAAQAGLQVSLGAGQEDHGQAPGQRMGHHGDGDGRDDDASGHGPRVGHAITPGGSLSGSQTERKGENAGRQFCGTDPVSTTGPPPATDADTTITAPPPDSNPVTITPQEQAGQVTVAAASKATDAGADAVPDADAAPDQSSTASTITNPGNFNTVAAAADLAAKIIAGNPAAIAAGLAAKALSFWASEMVPSPPRSASA